MRDGVLDVPPGDSIRIASPVFVDGRDLPADLYALGVLAKVPLQAQRLLVDVGPSCRGAQPTDVVLALPQSLGQ